jgi:hypothetical protein
MYLDRYEIRIKPWQILLIILLIASYYYVYHLGRAHYTRDYKQVKYACLQVQKHVNIEEHQVFSYMPVELRFICEE